MSVCTSPAIASPPTTATATGRNSGSTMPERREREQGPVGEHGREERRPGAGARTEVRHREQHRDQRRQRVQRRDRHPRPRAAQQLDQLDPDHGVAHSSASTICSRVRRTGSSPVTRTPAATRRALSVGGVVGADHDLGGPRSLHPAVEQRDRRADVGGAHPHQPVAARIADMSSWSTSRPRSSTPTRVRHLLDLGEQVAGQEDRRARPVQVEQQLADVPDALRVEAVGRLVEHEQRWAAHQRGRQPQTLAHPEGVRLHRATVARGRAPPASSTSAMRRAGRRGARVDRRPRRRARGWRGRTGGGRPRAPRRGRRRGAAPTRRPRHLLDRRSAISPSLASTSPSSIRTVVVLPEPLAPRNP